MNQGFSDKKPEKLDILELELDYNKDIIIKLKTELNSKKNEISLLKVNNNKITEEHQKNIRLINEILKQCDQSTKTGFNLLQNKLLNFDLNNNNKNELINSIPKVGNMLHFTQEQKLMLKKIIIGYKFKNKTNNLNEEIIKKNEKINEIKNNKNIINFNGLRNSYDKLNEMKNQNKFMKFKIEDSFNSLRVQKEKNIYLKNKLNSFQKNYKNFRNKTKKKIKSLENKFIDLENRELRCKIFHKAKSKKGNYTNYVLDNDIKKLSESMKQLKNSNNLENEIEKIKEKKLMIDKEINKLVIINESLKKELQEINEQIEIEEKNAIEQNNSFKLIIENKENKNLELKEINTNINKELRKKEKLFDEEKNNSNDLNRLLKERKKENKQLNENIEELQKKLEKMQKELIAHKDKIFLKEGGEIKISNNSDKIYSNNNNEKKENDLNKNDNKDEIINYSKKEEKKEGIKDIKKEDKEEKKEMEEIKEKKEDKEEIKEVYEEDKKDNINEQDNHKNENKENLIIDKNMVIQEEEKKSELEINESLKYIQKIFCIDKILNSNNIKLLKDVFKNLIYIKNEDDLFKTIEEKKFEAFIIILGLKQFPKYIDYMQQSPD